MNLIQSLIAPQGVRLAAFCLATTLALGAVTARAEYEQIGQTGLNLAADTEGVEIYRIDLFNASTWSGNDIRLVSFLGGEYWMIDTPIDLKFTGASTTLEGFGSTGTIDETLSFTTRGLLTPGLWSDGLMHYLGFQRTIEDVDYFGVLGVRYNQDNSLTLQRYGIMPQAMSIAAFEASVAVPEPTTAAAVLAALAVAGVAIRRRARRAGSAALAAA